MGFRTFPRYGEHVVWRRDQVAGRIGNGFLRNDKAIRFPGLQAGMMVRCQEKPAKDYLAWVFSTLVASSLMWPGIVTAQVSQCPKEPANGITAQVKCIANENEDIVIDVTDANIITSNDGAGTDDAVGGYGIHGLHRGTGDILLSTSDADVDTTGEAAYGIHGYHQGTGDIRLSTSDADVDTTGDGAHGIIGWHNGTGDIRLETSGTDIKTSGVSGHGIYGLHYGEGLGNIHLLTSDADIETSGENANGILSWHNGTGYVRLETSGTDIETSGKNANGIYGLHQGSGDVHLSTSGTDIETRGEGGRGIYGLHQGSGDVHLSTSGTDIETRGEGGRGIYGRHQGSGDVRLETSGTDIETSGENAHGIYGRHQGSGDVRLETSGTDIETSGENAHGIYGRHQGSGDVRLETSGTDIETSGKNAHGILVWHTDTGTGNIQLTVDERTKITATKAAAIRIINQKGRNDVHIYGTVRGDTLGLNLEGGGNVRIGPEGFLGAADGSSAIRSQDGDLRVDLLVRRRAPWKLVGGKFVVGEDALEVALNEVEVYKDGAPVDVWAPAGWREFRFDPDLNPGADELDFSQEASWQQRDLPNASLAEVLPGVLRRIHTVPCRMTSAHQQGVVAVTCGSRGKVTPDRSTTGSRYTYNQSALGAHMTHPLTEQMTGWLGLRQVTGDATVKTVGNVGNIKVRGPGFYGGLRLEGTRHYGEARLSLSRYDVDLRGETVSAEAKGDAYALDLEGGRHWDLTSGTRVTGRGWISHAEVSVSPFKDTLNVTATARDKRTTTGLGLEVKGPPATVGAGTFALHGGVGLEQVIDADSRATSAFGTLHNSAKNTSVLMDAGGVYRQNEWALRWGLFSRGLGADDVVYGLQAGLDWSF